MPQPQNNINTLYTLEDVKTTHQVCIFLITCSLVSFFAILHFGAPFWFALFCAAFFLLPLTGIKNVRHAARLAREAYESGETETGTAFWTGACWSDDVTWKADLDLPNHGKWRVKIARGYGIDKALKYPHMNEQITEVLVWVHPQTREPRFLMIGDHGICINEAEKII